MQNSQCFTQVNVGGITILGTVIIGGMIWITRSNVKFRIWVKSEGQFIENDTLILLLEQTRLKFYDIQSSKYVKYQIYINMSL